MPGESGLGRILIIDLVRVWWVTLFFWLLLMAEVRRSVRDFHCAYMYVRVVMMTTIVFGPQHCSDFRTHHATYYMYSIQWVLHTTYTHGRQHRQLTHSQWT